ncbi:MAG: MotA/TolQ/ExbB proton channel family protein [Chitinophagaceae bacterium]|nr:MAG: MotA/TolQ/ExbB proton channel family protein [Chitinophagaceae bacterium]
MIYFLQIIDTVSNTATSLNSAVTQADGNGDGSISLGELLGMGGWLMYPLLILLLLAIFFFVERWLSIRKAGRIDENFMNIIRDHIINGNVVAAKTFAKNTNNPVARIINKGIQRIGKPIDIIEDSMENVGRLEMYNLEKNLSVLSLVYGIAPMMGFLGTIIGMLQLFYHINATGEFTPAAIAGGIYTKMITSAAGLMIGLMAYVGYNFLTAQINKVTNKMEAAASEFMDVLQEPTK